MRVTSLGHACLLVEASGVRLLIDPGTYSPAADAVRDVDAVLVTHAHPDHVDLERLDRVLRAGAGATCLVEAETVDGVGLDAGTAVRPGDLRRIGDVEVTVVGGRHAANHDAVPPLGNVGFLLEADDVTLFHPGDSYDEAPDGVDVLALPLNAPWCRMQQTLDFLRAVEPRVAVPIHDGLLGEAGRSVYRMHVDRFGPATTQVVPLEVGSSYDVGDSAG